MVRRSGLIQGQAGSETNYGSAWTPRYGAHHGAEWIHLVDLDAAFGRGSDTHAPSRRGHRKLDVAVELSGGIRDDESLEAALSTGCPSQPRHRRARKPPEWCARVMAAARRQDRGRPRREDVRLRTPARARLEDRRRRPLARARTPRRRGCERYVVTDVTKDGTLAGPNLDLLSKRRGPHRSPGHRVRRCLHSTTYARSRA